MKLIISDIDNTLGTNELEIRAGIELIAGHQNSCDIAFITGRSLTALLNFEALIPNNAFLSPWGGGNILKKSGADNYVVIDELTSIKEFPIAGNINMIYLPDLAAISFKDERIIDETSFFKKHSLQCVGGYRRAENSELPPSINKGLNNERYELFTPFKLPRIHFINRMRVWYDTLIYIGDDHCDAICADFVAHFFAPAGSVAAKERCAVVYHELNDLNSLLLPIINHTDDK